MDAQVVCGDALTVLRQMESTRIALTVTSPPYFRHRDYGVAGQIGRETTLQGYLDRMTPILAELLRVTDDAGCCFMVVGDSYVNRRLQLVPHRLAIAAGEVGWTVRNDIIWSKSDAPPESPRNRWRAGHEHILFLTRRPSGYRFHADAVRVPYSPATLRRWGAGQSYGGAKSKGRRHDNDSRMRDGQTFRLNPGGCLPTDVWILPSSNSGVRHYAAFSEKLVRPMIAACTSPGDVVLDCFAGSGTTGVVALALGRRFLGVELNPEYAALANDLLTKVRAA